MGVLQKTWELDDRAYAGRFGQLMPVASAGSSGVVIPADASGPSPTCTHWLRDGKFARVLTVTDVVAMGRQIGAAPAAGSRAERLGVRMQHMAARKLRRAYGR